MNSINYRDYTEMKKILVLFLFCAFLLHSKHSLSQHSIRVGYNTYPSTPTWQFEPGGGGPSVNVTIGKRNDTGLLLLSSSIWRISGTIQVYLENNDIITCYERKSDRVDGRQYTLYYFTENEIRKLIRYNIDFIRFDASRGFGKESFTARSEIREFDLDLQRFRKKTHNTAEEIGRLFSYSYSKQNASNFRIYTNSRKRFSIEYPNAWTEFSMQGLAFAAINERTDENMNIVVIDNVNISLERVTESNLTELKQNIRNLDILNETSGVINGRRFTLTESKFFNPSIPGNQYTAIYCFVENRKAYIITFATKYESKQNLKALMNDIIKTIKFI